MGSERVKFHNNKPCYVLLPPLRYSDGTVFTGLSAATSISLITRRDQDILPAETFVGVTPVPGFTAGALSIYATTTGELALLTEPDYFYNSAGPVNGIIWVDGQDWPSDGAIIFVPEVT